MKIKIFNVMNGIKRSLIFFVVLFFCIYAKGQVNNKITVGVPLFSFENPSDSVYAMGITEKVMEMLIRSNRVAVVDRSTYDKAIAELELQKNEVFINSDNVADQGLVKQGVAVGAQYILSGVVRKLDIIEVTNADFSVSGYKALLGLQIKFVDVESGVSTEAVGFESFPSEKMFSPARAVDGALLSMEWKLKNYFMNEFPARGLVIKFNPPKTYILGLGTKDGLKVGDKITVESAEIIDGCKYYIKAGEMKVVGLTGTNGAECIPTGKNKDIIQNRFLAGEKLYGTCYPVSR